MENQFILFPLNVKKEGSVLAGVMMPKRYCVCVWLFFKNVKAYIFTLLL